MNNTNTWVKFFRKYGPIPQNDNMYDEAIRRAVRRTNVQPISFESPYLEDLIKNFIDPAPASVILTGTAGDGKTYLCREIWDYFGGSPAEWNNESKIKKVKLKNGNSLTVVKDLSELREEEKSVLKEIALSLTNNDGQLFLVAANDGQLMEAWNTLQDSAEIRAVTKSIEDALVLDRRKCGDFHLQLYNLSRYRSSDLLPKIMEGACNHPGWQGCDECLYAAKEPGKTCPIWLNLQLMQAPIFGKRLTELLLLCDYSNVHMPIRQLLILVANAILGHPGVKDQIMTCEDIPSIIQSDDAWRGNIYTNVFGSNLRLRRLSEIFETLRGFGIGEETSNYIDNMIILGADNPDDKQREYFTRFIASDENYGANNVFLHSQGAYLEGENEELEQVFLKALSIQRQRLFFVASDESINDLSLWNLSLFHYAGEYINNVVKQATLGRRISKAIIDRLICGLNRIFTGMLTRTTKDMWLATSGNYSQARVNKMVEGHVSVMPHREEYIDIKLNESGMVELVVNMDKNISVSLPLHLVRYEFLSRVAEGALPSSFSRECYEDILSFKSKLLAKYKEIPGAKPTDVVVHFLSLDERSQLVENPIYVKIGDGA